VRSAPIPTPLLLDNHLLVLDKPAGMPSQADASGDLSAQDWAKAWLAERFDKPGRVFCALVHRLDRPTSGVLLLARTSKAASRLSAAVRERRVQKTYLALCCARPRAEPGLLEDWLLPGGAGINTVRCAAEVPGAQRAALRWRLLAEGPAGVLCEIELLTGRKHQIRAQLAARGAPLRGDHRYGATRPLALGAIALHAARLRLPHPVGGAELVVEAPPPPWAALTGA
jgi:23S rRNA pseudouridine1911/1915/1917 synthase